MTARGFTGFMAVAGACLVPLTACGSAGSSSSSSTAAKAPASAQPTTAADPAVAAYLADVQAEYLQFDRVSTGYGLVCAGDGLPPATATKCGNTAAAMKPLITEFLAHLAAAKAPAKLTQADTHLRDVLNRMLPAIDDVVKAVSTGATGSLPRDLFGLQGELFDTVGSVTTAASA